MTNIYDRGPIDINERSQPIQTGLVMGLTWPVHHVSSHKCSSTNVLRRSTKPSNMMLYSYPTRELCQETSQTSWVRGRLLVTMFVI